MPFLGYVSNFDCEPTYEELKLLKSLLIGIFTFLNCEPTYEELKQYVYVRPPHDCGGIASLPMRN